MQNAWSLYPQPRFGELSDVFYSDGRWPGCREHPSSQPSSPVGGDRQTKRSGGDGGSPTPQLPSTVIIILIYLLIVAAGDYSLLAMGKPSSLTVLPHLMVLVVLPVGLISGSKTLIAMMDRVVKVFKFLLDRSKRR